MSSRNPTKPPTNPKKHFKNPKRSAVNKYLEDWRSGDQPPLPAATPVQSPPDPSLWSRPSKPPKAPKPTNPSTPLNTFLGSRIPIGKT